MDLRPPRVDVVIAGDGEHAERRGELAEGVGERLDVAGVVVHLIPGDGDQVRPGLADRRRHPRQVATRGVGADVEIGDLDDRIPSSPAGRSSTRTSRRRTTSRRAPAYPSRASPARIEALKANAQRPAIALAPKGRPAATPSTPEIREQRQEEWAYQKGRTRKSRRSADG